MERLTKKMESGNVYLPATTAKTTGEFTMRYAKELQRLGELEEKIENGELVERRQGRWLKLNPLSWYDFECSCCHATPDTTSNFCPDCGAKMLNDD